MQGHTYILLHPERKKPHVPLEVIEYDDHGNPFCFYKAYWTPWRGWKLYPAFCRGIMNKSDKVKTVAEAAVRPKQ